MGGVAQFHEDDASVAERGARGVDLAGHTAPELPSHSTTTPKRHSSQDLFVQSDEQTPVSATSAAPADSHTGITGDEDSDLVQEVYMDGQRQTTIMHSPIDPTYVKINTIIAEVVNARYYKLFCGHCSRDRDVNGEPFKTWKAL